MYNYMELKNNPADIEHAEKVGIQPQLVDWKKKQLVMDFMIVRNDINHHAFRGNHGMKELVVSTYFL